MGNFNACPSCPPFRRPTVWKCREKPPEGIGLPEPWTVAKVVVKTKR